MQKIIGIISKFGLNLFISFLIIFMIILGLSVFPVPGMFRIFSVMSGSMEPTIQTGSVVLVKLQKDLKVGDIVTAKTKDTGKNLTHRIVAITSTGLQKQYETRGDANDSNDSEKILQENVIGKVVLAIPFLGFPISFSKTLPGLIILIIIPATIIVYSELVKIKNETVRIVNQKKKNNIEIVAGLLILISVLSFKYTGTTNSGLLDLEKTVGNSISATTWATPQAMLSVSADRKTASFLIEDVKDYEKISYILSYDSLQGKQGILGDATLSSQEEFKKAGLTLGTCTSGGNCTYHSDIYNLELNIELTNRNGKLTTLQSK